MLNGKQRAALRAAANGLEAWFQIVKSGIGGNMTADISAALDAHELVKITVLRTAPSEPKTLLRTLAQTLGAEEVSAVGNKIVLYRRSEKEGVKHIEF